MKVFLCDPFLYYRPGRNRVDVPCFQIDNFLVDSELFLAFENKLLVAPLAARSPVTCNLFSADQTFIQGGPSASLKFLSSTDSISLFFLSLLKAEVK